MIPLVRAGLGVAPAAASGAVEDFSGTPDITVSSSTDVYVDATVGNPSPSLRGSGSGDWWYFNDPVWTAAGGFDVTYDVILNPGAAGAGRDIANFGFYLRLNGTLIWHGFMLRLDGAPTSGGFYRVDAGSHTDGGGIRGAQSWSGPRAESGTYLGSITDNQWFRVRLVTSGVDTSQTISATVHNLTSAEADTVGTFNIGSFITADHPTNGTFGQKADGAGSSVGHRWDNITLA